MRGNVLHLHLICANNDDNHGGGRTFLTERAADLPDLLMDEAEMIIQPSIIEGVVTPLRGAPHPAIRSIDAAPDLSGYVLTTPRDTAQVTLVTPEGDTLMAAWQYGLGRSIAWTSDFSGRWAKEWMAWDRFPQFGAHLFNWLLPLQTDDVLSIATHPSGDTLTIETIARRPDGSPWSGLLVSVLHLQETFSDVVKTDKTGLSKTAHTRWMISAFANFLPGSTIFRLA